MPKTLIFDIKRYAINDGPGIRIVIFFKGCNLNCAWCHNPEGISFQPELMYSHSRCILCGTCVNACPEGALSLTKDGIEINGERCLTSGKCTTVCPSRALELTGEAWQTETVMQEIEKEHIFFEQSGGGVTFSGGEPLLHTEMLIPLLHACRSVGIHTAVDTAGLVGSNLLAEVANLTDLFLYDLKMMDSARHRQWTGVSNEQILENLQWLASAGANINIRIPLIGEVNDDRENMEMTAAFVSGLDGLPKKVSLLPYHKIAAAKYSRLGRPDAFVALKEPSLTTLKEALEIFERKGLEANIG